MSIQNFNQREYGHPGGFEGVKFLGSRPGIFHKIDSLQSYSHANSKADQAAKAVFPEMSKEELVFEMVNKANADCHFFLETYRDRSQVNDQFLTNMVTNLSDLKNNAAYRLAGTRSFPVVEALEKTIGEMQRFLDSGR